MVNPIVNHPQYDPLPSAPGIRAAQETCGCHLGACRPRKRVTVQSCWNMAHSVENMNMGHSHGMWKMNEHDG